jgi:hypothetical protein
LNLIENISGATITGTTTGNILGQDPKLGLLASNGGPTLTHALLPGSPAIEAADPANVLPSDQRGFARPKDGDRNGVVRADIGAFERGLALDSTLYDFDGDGKTDVAIFRPSIGVWWYLRSIDGADRLYQFGLGSDKQVPADYTGDGRTDVAFFHPTTGEWFVERSEDDQFYAFTFGAPGDIPAPGDYDGDGKADAAVFRPSIASWFILGSTSGVQIVPQFGSAEDKPVPASFIP